MLANAGYRGLGKVRRTLFSTLDIMEAVGESLFWIAMYTKCFHDV